MFKGKRIVRQSAALVLLAKYPEPKRVKTRLVNGTEENRFTGLKDLHDLAGNTLDQETAYQIAADLYRAFLLDRFAAHQRRTYDVILGMSQKEYDAQFLTITGPDVRHHLTGGAHLGELMFHLFSDLLGTYKKVLISGSDFPYLDETVIERVLGLLDVSEVVLVPAHDGAYNLIGLSRLHNLFSLSRWSSGSELAETVTLLKDQHIPYAVLDDLCLVDIDTLEDLRLLIRTIRPHQAPATTAFLKQLQDRLRLVD